MLTKLCSALTLAAALTMPLSLLSSCDQTYTPEQRQARIQDVLHTNAQIQKFLNTCEQNDGIRELTSSSTGSRGARYLYIRCNNGLEGRITQFN